MKAALSGIIAFTSLCTACGAQVFDAGPPPETEAPTPFVITGAQADLVFTIADDEDAIWPGIQTVLRIDVHDPAIERVELSVLSPAGEEVLDDVVSEDLDGALSARFLVTLGAQPETPVRAFSPDLPPAAYVEAHAVLRRAD